METRSIGQTEWASLSPDEKQKLLFMKQKKMLDTFREKNATSQEQYEDGVRYLKERMKHH